MIKIAIVEDDKESTESLVNLLKKIQTELNVILSISSFPDGLAFLDTNNTNFDIVFMDIDMPIMNGVEASKKLRDTDRNVELIFTTALSQYAIFGYDVSASAFLVKPFTEDEKAIERIKNIIVRKSEEEKNFFIFQKDKSSIKVLYNEITYIESFNHYCVFHTKDNLSYKKTCSMKSVEEILTTFGFLRCDNSYLINPLYANKWEKDTVDINSKKIPISRSRRKEFFEKLALTLGEKYQ